MKIRGVLLFLSALLTLSFLASPVFAQEEAAPSSPPFRFGIYMSGSDSPGMRYWVDPLGLSGPREYVKYAFNQIKDLGFDLVWMNHVDPADLPWILEEAGSAGLEFVFQGIGFPSYYEHKDGYESFPPNSPKDLNERNERRRRLKEETIPFYRQWASTFQNRRSLLAWSMTEEIPRDPMIYEDLAGFAATLREVDPGRAVAIEYHWLEALEESVPIIRPSIVMAGPYSITKEFREQPDRWVWMLYGDFGVDTWIDRAHAATSAVGAQFWILGTGSYAEERATSGGSWKPSQNPVPTIGEIRAEMWLAIIGGANAFAVFQYNTLDDAGQAQAARKQGREPFGPGAEDFTHRMFGLYDVEGSPTPMVEMIQQVIAEVRPLADLLGTLERQEDAPWPYFQEGTRIHVRAFRQKETNAEYLIIVNPDPDEDQSVELDLTRWAKNARKVRQMPDGPWKSARRFTPFWLQPGGGIVLELERTPSAQQPTS